MFGIGGVELLVILAIALIFLGPKKLPGLAKSLGKGLNEFKKASKEVQDSLNVEDDNLSDKSDRSSLAPELPKYEAAEHLRDAEIVKENDQSASNSEAGKSTKEIEN